MSSLSLVSATAGAAAASGAAGASRYSSRWGKYLLFYVLKFLNPLLSFHIIRDCADGGSVLAFSRGKCVVFQAREETGRRQSFSPLLSVLTETLRDIFARAHTFGKCGAFMVEATSRLIDACRLNPSSGGGGGCRSAGGGGRSGNPGGSRSPSRSPHWVCTRTPGLSCLVSSWGRCICRGVGVHCPWVRRWARRGEGEGEGERLLLLLLLHLLLCRGSSSRSSSHSRSSSRIRSSRCVALLVKVGEVFIILCSKNFKSPSLFSHYPGLCGRRKRLGIFAG